MCQLSQGSLGEERYCVYVLNRRGLNNFELLLTDAENVELTDEYVILKADGDGNNNTKKNGNTHPHTNNSGIDDDVRFYGLWIYSEPPPASTAKTRTLNAQMIKECAVHAGQSRKFAEERQEAMHQSNMHVAAIATSATIPPTQEFKEVQSAAGVPNPKGRRISLQELFGQQRAVDDEWSTRAHAYPVNNVPLPPQIRHQEHLNMHPYPYSHPAPLTSEQPPQPPQPPPQQDVLGDLFRRAGLAYQGT